MNGMKMRPEERLTAEDIKAIQYEIADLEAFRDLAVSITENAKGKSLIQALTVRICQG